MYGQVRKYTFIVNLISFKPVRALCFFLSFCSVIWIWFQSFWFVCFVVFPYFCRREATSLDVTSLLVNCSVNYSFQFHIYHSQVPRKYTNNMAFETRNGKWFGFHFFVCLLSFCFVPSFYVNNSKCKNKSLAKHFPVFVISFEFFSEFQWWTLMICAIKK